MARPESRKDLMHVPTPACVVDSLRAMLAIPDGCIALDPCCGDGTALQTLAPRARRFGVELELERARLATTKCEQAIVGAIQEARISHDCFGLCLLNPPYDDSTEGRLEEVFLERTLNYLQAGGVLVLIVKESQVERLANILRRHYEVHGHWRFPAGYYDGPHLAFGQTVLLATKRALPAYDIDPVLFAYDVLKIGRLEDLPPALEAPLKVPMGQRPRLFISGAMGPADLALLLESSPLSRRMELPSELGCGRPPLPLKQGHIALTLASGMVNGVYGSGADLHVSKGAVVRLKQVEKAPDVSPNGKASLVVTTTDSFAITVRALRPDGTIHDMVAKPATQEAVA